MNSDQNDWLRRNTLTPEQKEAERRAFSRSWSRSSAKILAREQQEHAIYGTFQSSPITVDSISAAGASIDADAKLWASLSDRDRRLRAGYSAQLTDFLDKHLYGVDPDFEVKKSPAPAAPSDLPTDPELRALVLQIRELAKD